MGKTIIVTGGAGFIGSNFIFHILGKYPEYRIVCLDKLTYVGEPVHAEGHHGQSEFPVCKSGYLRPGSGISAV